ncbi:MAG: iron-sulfur cluster assembly scaffold protein, partial [Pyrinomonadaceae bacterium]|nr:iron-sulfur cluster assembly scaffold protein [Pyrinomonadaceae bacterium]
KNVGGLNGANAVGTSASFVCGVFLRFSLRIDVSSKKILEAKFQTNGCGYLIASADVLAEKVTGKHLNKIHTLDEKVLQTEIENALGKFSKHRKHCLDLTLETLQNAFADFRAGQIEEFAGEKALICTCFGVAEETIEKVIKQNSIETVEDVTDACGAGGGCGSCRMLIQEMIDVYQSEN